MIDIARIIEKSFLPRDLLSSILPWIDERECVLIVGSRQVGKTSLLYLLVQHLFEQKVISDENLCFLDFEDPADLELASLSPEDLLKALRLRGKKWNSKRSIYIILDEVHLASALGLNQRTVGRYLDILEATFILARVLPYRTSVRKRLIRAPKIYFCDNGLRNMTLGDFSPIHNRTDHGVLAESMIFQYLLRRTQVPEAFELSFWRTSSGGEVDFIWNDTLIEVKSWVFTNNPPRALLSCMADTGMNKAVILNRSRMDRLKNKEQEIIFFPYGLLK